MKIVTAAEMREIDRLTSEKFGVPSLTLMENAGAAVAEFVLASYASAATVGVICGKGNNGGDGLVAARKLHEAGKQVHVVLLADPAEVRGDAAAMLKKLPVRPVVVLGEDDLKTEPAQRAYHADVLVDAILGTGFRPPVEGLYAAAVKRFGDEVRARECPVIAVDIPSGADSDALGAEATVGVHAPASAVVTFTAPKPRHILDAELADGPVVVAPIGSPEEAVESSLNLNVATAREMTSAWLPRSPDGHKGDYGHVLVIGGSVGKAGAAAMAGMAALRAGAGLVTVATAKTVLPMVAGFAAELMTEPLEETEIGTISMRALEYGRLDKIVAGKTVLAIGPGISRHPDTVQFVRAIIGRYDLPVVLDADGLNAFEGAAELLDGRRRPLVLTPHPGEMARLAGISTKDVQADRIGVARRFAQEHHCTVVLKGHRTLIAHDERVWVNTTGNPGMASGGMGDILTGLVAGMIAQAKSDPGSVEPVVTAVHLHGLAADIARDESDEHCLAATDLLVSLPRAFRRIRERVSEKLVHVVG